MLRYYNILSSEGLTLTLLATQADVLRLGIGRLQPPGVCITFYASHVL